MSSVAVTSSLGSVSPAGFSGSIAGSLIAATRYSHEPAARPAVVTRRTVGSLMFGESLKSSNRARSTEAMGVGVAMVDEPPTAYR